MFEKIPRIENLGSFYKLDSTVVFNNTNIIYALNGYGKTTFTSIIRSIKENNPSLLIGRKSFKANVKDKISIICNCSGKNTYKFTGDKWLLNEAELTQRNNNIIIFDDEFVNNNIFAEKFEIEHKKALYKIIFGADGIKISKDLTELRRNKKTLNDEVVALQKNLTLKFYQLDAFLKLNPNNYNKESLNHSLSEIIAKIENISNSQKILNKSLLLELQFLSFDIQSLILLLHKNVSSDAHNQAKQKVSEYKKRYFLKESDFESFIKLGYENKTEDCPFCHKKLDDSILLNTYRDFFDKSYNDFFQEIKKHFDLFNSWNIETAVFSISTTQNNNSLKVKEWHELINDLSELPVLIIDTELPQLKKEIEELLKLKLNNLNDVIDSNLLEKFKIIIDNLNLQIKDYNSVVTTNNLKIINFKEKISVTELTSLTKQRDRLNDELDRVSQKTINLCENINGKLLEVSNFDANIAKKEIELNKYSENISKEYLEIINNKLDFLQIDNFKLKAIEKDTRATANEAFVEITIEMHSQTILLNSYKDEKASFKNTLSRGDKNSLAFAFFLAFIEKKANLENAILFFDDPLSSHDENRQIRTALAISNLKQRVSQVFVLTHKKTFFNALFSKFNSESSYFKINQNINGSFIKKMEKDEILDKTEYEKIIEKFNKYINFGATSSPELSIGNLKNDIRKAFENVLFTKYYNKLKDVSFSVTSYSHLKDYFFDTNIITGEVKNELIDLAQISNDGSHFREYEDMNEVEIKKALTKTLEIIEKL